MTIWLGEVRRWPRPRTLPEALPSVLPRVSQSRGSLRALRLLRSPACSFCSRAVDFLAPARLAEAWGQRGARFQEQACETLLDHEGSPWPCPLGRPRVGRWLASPLAAASRLIRKRRRPASAPSPGCAWGASVCGWLAGWRSLPGSAGLPGSEDSEDRVGQRRVGVPRGVSETLPRPQPSWLRRVAEAAAVGLDSALLRRGRGGQLPSRGQRCFLRRPRPSGSSQTRAGVAWPLGCLLAGQPPGEHQAEARSGGRGAPSGTMVVVAIVITLCTNSAAFSRRVLKPSTCRQG